MAKVNVIPAQKINSAAGDNQYLREILQALTNTQNQQQQVTNTTAKNVPPQAKATVSFLRNNYVVEIENPGTTNPSSALQLAQAAKTATTQTNTAAITPIYHQIRVATSPQFNISSAVKTYGGNTGSTSVYWSITDLDSGRWYFQLRSSYDGVNWNLWRNANGGQTITPGIEGVTIETAENAVWALFELPGKQLVSIGTGLVPDQGSFGVPTELYSSAMKTITGPNGFVSIGSNLAHGIVKNEVDLVTPSDLSGVTNPPDFPTLVRQLYEDGDHNQWSGTSNLLAFCYDPLASNVKVYPTADGSWIEIILPGGARIAFGSGVSNDGDDLATPGMSWFDPTRMVSIVTPRDGYSLDNQAHGIDQAFFENDGPGHEAVCKCAWRDGSGNRWGSTANYFALAYDETYPVTAVAQGSYIIIKLPAGGSIAIGAGWVANNGTVPLPSGDFTSENMLSFVSPRSFYDTGHPCQGIANCGMVGLNASVTYTDTESNVWGGDVNWFLFLWT